MLIKANYNQQMWGTSWGTDYSAIKLFVLGLAINEKTFRDLGSLN